MSLGFDDSRTPYATPHQMGQLWGVIGSLRKQIEELTARLDRVEGDSAQRAEVSGDENRGH